MALALLSLLFTLLTPALTQQVYNIAAGDIKRLSLSPNITHQFNVTVDNKDSKWEGFIIQAHAQHQKIVLSSTPNFAYGDYGEGTSVGLWKGLKSGVLCRNAFFLRMLSPTNETVMIMVAIVPIENEAPIPGGCTLTSALDTDPNLQLNYTYYTTTVTFSSGNVGYDIMKTTSPPSCSTVPGDKSNVFKVKYTLYRQLLNLGDYKESTMFDAIETLLTPKDISDHKSLASLPVNNKGAKLMTLDSFYGDGVVYNVHITSSGKSSMYVPKVTYACDFGPERKHCEGPLVNKILSPVLGVVGLFLCYLAHRLWHLEVFVFSWVIFVLVWYICLSLITGTSHTVRVSVSFVASLVCALGLFMIWFFLGRALVFVLFFNLMVGFLIAATVLYTQIGTIDMFQIGYLYFLVFLCLMVLFLIPAVIAPRPLNIFATSLVGGYLVIFSIGSYVFTSLTEILMQVVKNSTIGGYLKTDSDYPFSTNDIILVAVWGLLLVSGIIVQAILARKRDPFPKETLFKVLKTKVRERRQRGASGERRLLINKVSSPTSSLY